MLGAARCLQPYGVRVDAVESRSYFVAPGLVRSYRNSGRLPGTLVLHLGTNGPFPASVFDATIRAAGPSTRVIVLNVREPRPWEGQVNRDLRAAARRWPSMTLLDWYSASAGRVGTWLYGDGIHLRQPGCEAYSRFIRSAL